MTVSLDTTSQKSSRLASAVEFMFNLFLRILAIAFFALALQTWLTVIGYWEGPNYRFDTMSATWKVYTAVLVVLLPVTSVGLWTTLSWGRVVWFLAIGFQILGFFLYAAEFGANELLVLFHLSSLGIYITFQLALHFIAKKA